jgi:hypothetical protein
MHALRVYEMFSAGIIARHATVACLAIPFSCKQYGLSLLFTYFLLLILNK